MGQVVLKSINKFFDSVHAVKDVNLQIRAAARRRR